MIQTGWWDVPGPKANRRLLAPLAMLAIALGGCSTDLSGFSAATLNPFKGEDPLRSADYNYFYRREQSNVGFVTASDLVGPDGRCAFGGGPGYAQAAPGPASGPEVIEAAAPTAPPSAPIDARSNRALYFTAGPETGRVGNSQQAAIPADPGNVRGIALSMTECQVVGVAGYTDRVEISANERGQRVVKLTYVSGSRPGIYHFRDGRLTAMDRVEVAPPPKPQRPARNAKAKQRQ